MNTSPDNPGRNAPPELSTEFFRSILDRSPDLITVVDAEGRILYSTSASDGLLGFAPDERTGRSIFDQVHPDDREEQRATFARLASEPGAVVEAEFRMLHRDGRQRVVHGKGRNLLDDPNVRGVLLHTRDITAHRQAELERDEARALLSRVVDQVPVVLFLVDPDGTYLLSEGKGLESLGLRPGEAVGENAFELHPEADRGVQLIRRALAGERAEDETPVGERVFHTVVGPVEGPDGGVVAALGVSFDVTDRERESEKARFRARLLQMVGQAVVVTDAHDLVMFWNQTAEELFGWSSDEVLGRSAHSLMVPGELQEEAAAIRATLVRGERWAGEFAGRAKDGRIFPTFVTTVPLMEEGEPVAFISVVADLRERKALEEQLHQAQKMEAVGRLAGGIAHDFNNLLTAIGGYAGMAAERAMDEQLAADIAEVVDATERARGLVDKLLTFSRRSQAAPQPVDVDGRMRALGGMLRRMIGEDIRLDTELAAGAWRAKVDPVQLDQAVINLVINARDALPTGGRITVRTDRVSLSPERAGRLGKSVVPGEYVRLVVQDDGTGIEEAARERIFEPFFTTKPVGKGSGLGLSIVFGAVTRAGGGVEVDSEPGQGTRVSLYLPRTEAVAAPGAEAPAPERGETGGVAAAAPEAGIGAGDRAPTVLLVEDETAVRALARRVLERAGYTVVEAGTGLEAERLVSGSGLEADLLLTDVIMPEMGGPELAFRLTARQPALRVLYMSGYTADELASRGLDEDEERLLSKPFSPDQLTRAVRQAMRS